MNPKQYRPAAILCWLGVAIAAVLSGYMLRMAGKYPGVEAFARNTRLAGVLLLVWLAAAVWFTARARKSGKK